MAQADGFDAVVVGAGQNGLSAAVALGMAGRRVLVVEANSRVGGAMRTEEFTLPGFRHDVGATVVPLTAASPAFRAIRPTDDGLVLKMPKIMAGHPLEGRDPVLVHRSVEETAAGLGVDGRAYQALIGYVARAGFPLYDTLMSPIGIPKAPLRAVRYGASGALPASWVAKAFRTERARAVFAGMAAHSVLNLNSLVTAGYGSFLMGLAHGVGWPVVEGGTERLAEVLSARIVSQGGEIVTSQRVTDLAELPRAPIMILDLTPRQVAAVAGDRLPPRYRRKLNSFRMGPGVFKIDWAMDGPVPWRDQALATAGTVHLGGSFAEIAASERDAVNGKINERPFVLTVQASVPDPTRAPAGKHTFWAYCHVPNGSAVDMTAAIEAQVERYAPGFRDRILARHVMPPRALEAYDANLVGGDISGGASDLRQFVARPTLSAHPFATPVPGLYIGSSSTPPGGGVHGMGGWQAAQLALRRDRR